MAIGGAMRADRRDPVSGALQKVLGEDSAAAAEERGIQPGCWLHSRKGMVELITDGWNGKLAVPGDILGASAAGADPRICMCMTPYAAPASWCRCALQLQLLVVLPTVGGS